MKRGFCILINREGGRVIYLLILAFLLIAGLIWKLTGGGKLTPGPFDSVQTAQEILLVPVGIHTKAESDVLVEMMDRLGIERQISLDELDRRGFPIEGLSDVSSEPHLSVVRRDSELKNVLEQALLVGIHIARTDDDYARVGDDTFDPAIVAAHASDAEIALFGDGWKERHRLYGKVALVLQDMLQEKPSAERRRILISLLQGFDEKLDRLQEELTQAMAKLPESDALQWGDGRHRRAYYFKMGVTHMLRRSGLLESFAHLYRHQGVNYNVEEAYRLAARECAPLALAENLGIDRLIEMGPSEVEGLVRGMLSERDEK